MNQEKKVQQRMIESREKLLRAAYQLFAKKGFYNTNTKEISREAGISVGNFYNYFKDKADIYNELVRQYVSMSRRNLSIMLEELLAKVDQMTDIQDVIAVVDEYACQQLDRAEESGILFKDAYMIQRDNEELDQILKESEQKITTVLGEFIKKCPGIRKRASYPVMARMLFVMGDTISIDLIRMKEQAFYDEYRREMSNVLAEYLFGSDWKRE